ncbi:MAG: TonB-dependent receptor plug domain-containing protein, partial [Phocaeicola sp.]
MRKKVLLLASLCCAATVVSAQSVSKEKVVNEKESQTLESTTLNELSLKLNEVVVTGTGTDRKLRNSPVAIDVVSQKELRNVNTPTFERAMMAIAPSFSVTPNAMGSHMQLNGLGNRYIRVLVNGQKLAGDVSGNTDLSRINLTNIKRIEVLKGAASALYGSDAIGGVINIITNDPQESLFVTSTTRYAEYGQFTQSINVDINRKWFTSSTSFQRNQSDGWQLSKQEISGSELIDTDKKAVNADYSDVFNQKFTFKLSPSFSLYTQGSLYDKRIKRSPSAYTYDLKYDDYTLGGGAKYLLKNESAITLDFHTDNFEYHRIYIKKSGDYVAGDETRERRQKYYDANLKGVFNLGAYNRLSVGTQYQVDYLRGNSDVKGSKDLYTYAIYAQDEIKLLNEKLQFVPGVRYVYNEAFGSRLTPKLSAMYALEHFNFRASYSAGFRTPDLKELYAEVISGTTLNIGNANLNPETSNYYSLNAEYHTSFLTLSLTGYTNRINNIIQAKDISNTITEQEQAEGIKRKREYANSSRARATGLEVSANSYLGHGLNIGLGYSYVDTKDYDTGNPLIRSSKHIGTAHANWEKKWWILNSNINLNGRIQSSRY